MMRERRIINLDKVRDLEQYVRSIYFSHQYVRTKILKQNELEQKESIDKVVEK